MPSFRELDPRAVELARRTVLTYAEAEPLVRAAEAAGVSVGAVEELIALELAGGWHGGGMVWRVLEACRKAREERARESH